MNSSQLGFAQSWTEVHARADVTPVSRAKVLGRPAAAHKAGAGRRRRGRGPEAHRQALRRRGAPGAHGQHHLEQAARHGALRRRARRRARGAAQRGAEPRAREVGHSRQGERHAVDAYAQACCAHDPSSNRGWQRAGVEPGARARAHAAPGRRRDGRDAFDAAYARHRAVGGGQHERTHSQRRLARPVHARAPHAARRARQRGARGSLSARVRAPDELPAARGHVLRARDGGGLPRQPRRELHLQHAQGPDRAHQQAVRFLPAAPAPAPRALAPRARARCARGPARTRRARARARRSSTTRSIGSHGSARAALPRASAARAGSFVSSICAG